MNGSKSHRFVSLSLLGLLWVCAPDARCQEAPEPDMRPVEVRWVEELIEKKAAEPAATESKAGSASGSAALLDPEGFCREWPGRRTQIKDVRQRAELDRIAMGLVCRNGSVNQWKAEYVRTARKPGPIVDQVFMGLALAGTTESAALLRDLCRDGGNAGPSMQEALRICASRRHRNSADGAPDSRTTAPVRTLISSGFPFLGQVARRPEAEPASCDLDQSFPPVGFVYQGQVFQTREGRWSVSASDATSTAAWPVLAITMPWTSIGKQTAAFRYQLGGPPSADRSRGVPFQEFLVVAETGGATEPSVKGIWRTGAGMWTRAWYDRVVAWEGADAQ